jgi:hypothetical protein
MALSIAETFGYRIGDKSEAAVAQRKSLACPFTGEVCWKRFRSGGLVNGVCVVKPTTTEEVIICPDRLYAESYKIVKDVAAEVFGPEVSVISPSEMAATQGQPNRVVAFGNRWGKELRVPKNASQSSDYAADWILARTTETGALEEFVPVEVQSIDTTGSYQRLWYELNGLQLPEGLQPTPPGLNWENVNKRIIPQLLVKGNVFGRETLCKKGLFFVCPTPVYKRLIARLGTPLSPWPLRSNSLTFRWYDLEAQGQPGSIRKLQFQGQFTTSVENFKEAYNSTLNLPAMNVMQETITRALQHVLNPKAKKVRSSAEVRAVEKAVTALMKSAGLTREHATAIVQKEKNRTS